MFAMQMRGAPQINIPFSGTPTNRRMHVEVVSGASNDLRQIVKELSGPAKQFTTVQDIETERRE